MVDPYAYFQFNRHEAINLRALGAVDPINDLNSQSGHHGHGGGLGGLSPLPPRNQRYEMYDNRVIVPAEEKKTRPGESEQTKLSEEDLLICVPFVRGYSFKSKEWGMFSLVQRMRNC